MTFSQPLLHILQSLVLPQWQQGGIERCLIAPPDLEDERVLERWHATGGAVSSSPYKGKRVPVKGPRNYNQYNSNIAVWPDDMLQERKSAIFLYVIDGRTDFQVGQYLVHGHSGHSMIILPGTPRPDGSTPHIAENNRHQGHCSLLWISSESDAGLGCWVCHSEGHRHFERPGESCWIRDPVVVDFFENFLLEAVARRMEYNSVCNHLFQALLLIICREIKEERIFQFNHQKPKTVIKTFHSPEVNDPITAAQEYIKDNLHRPLRIDDVARQVLLSRTEFTTSFRRKTGKSFHEYLTEVRLHEARNLLINTDFSIEMISKAVSFQSSRLRVLFNRYHAMSPQQFRAMNRSTSPN